MWLMPWRAVSCYTQPCRLPECTERGEQPVPPGAPAAAAAARGPRQALQRRRHGYDRVQGSDEAVYVLTARRPERHGRLPQRVAVLPAAAAASGQICNARHVNIPGSEMRWMTWRALVHYICVPLPLRGTGNSSSYTKARAPPPPPP